MIDPALEGGRPIATPLAALPATEGAFDRWRRVAGVALSPIAFFTVYGLTAGQVTPEGQSLAAILAAVTVLWVTETLPLPVTALTGAILCIVLGVAPARQVGWLLWEVKSAVVSGTFLAFSRAFTELGAALIVGGNIRGTTRTLTTYIALEYDRGDDARAIALGLILLTVALLTNSVLHALVTDR